MQKLTQQKVNEFKRGGYNIKTIGYRFQKDASEEQTAAELTAQELMDEILEEMAAELGQ